MSATTTAAGALVEERRVSLSRGPALILGTIMLAAGLYFLYQSHFFPPLHQFPNGTAHVRNHVFFGIFGCNGWTGMGTAIAGGLLLFGAAQHHLAKLVSLIVGGVSAAAAIIAAVSGNVAGLAAANAWTEIGWGACAVVLLGNALLPAYRRRVALIPAAATGIGAATVGAETASPQDT